MVLLCSGLVRCILRTEIINRDLGALTVQEPYHTAIFTNACEMEHLEYLIQALPNVHFHILAHTVLASIVKGVDWFSKFMNFLCNRHNFIKMIDIKIKIVIRVQLELAWRRDDLHF